MNILQNQRKFPLAAIVMSARFADRTRGRISPKRFVIRAAIVITGKTKSRRSPKYQKRGRKRNPRRNPRRFCAEHRVRRIAEKFGRIKRRKIISKTVMFALKRRPSRINDKRRQSDKSQQRRQPPRASPHSFAKRTTYRKTCRRHIDLTATSATEFWVMP